MRCFLAMDRMDRIDDPSINNESTSGRARWCGRGSRKEHAQRDGDLSRHHDAEGSLGTYSSLCVAVPLLTQQAN